MAASRSSEHPRKLLLSAYSIDPEMGSEPGVAWNWLLSLTRMGFDVTVITREIFRPRMERGKDALPGDARVSFEYYDSWVLGWIWSIPVFGKYAYYYLWQYLAAAKILAKYGRDHFDIVHHITFGSIRFPSFMWKLGGDFLLGPVGGAETYPRKLREDFPLRPRIAEWVRGISRRWMRRDPLLRPQFRHAKCIWVRTLDNADIVNPANRSKVRTVRDVAISPSTSRPPLPAPQRDGLRCIFVGRVIHWKGLQIGIRAFARLYREYPESRLEVVGDGPARQSLEELARQLGCAEGIIWQGHIERSVVRSRLLSNDVFLFPSLHDSGATVLVEAAECARPSIVLDLGGPGEKVTEDIGWRISTSGKTLNEVAADMAEVLSSLAEDPQQVTAKGARAFDWSQTQTWDAIVAEAYAHYDEVRTSSQTAETV